MKSRLAIRVLALLALLAWAGTVAALVLFAVDHLDEALGAIACTVVAVPAAWLAAVRRSGMRIVAAIVAVAAVAGAIVILIAGHAVFEIVLYAVTVAIASAATRFVLRRGKHAHGWRRAAETARPVLIMNPWSGGGKVERFGLVEECEKRGIKPVVLQKGDDLRQLALDAVQEGTDAIGIAGGDGSQAIVAGVASEHDLPYVCIPAGTRNHLALDLGIDRDDVVGALDAYGEHGLERRVDLATVNGRTFVNNVSLGIYASIVQSDSYRDDKVGTTLRRLPELLGPDADPFDLHFDGPDGGRHETADLLMVSNDPYRLDRLFGMGSRPHMDRGELGVVAVRIEGAGALAQFVALESTGHADRFSGWRAWSVPEFVVESSEPVPAGVDGEALRLDAPLRFVSKPRALRVRIAPHHPGRSPAATWPDSLRAAVVELARTAFGRHNAG